MGCVALMSRDVMGVGYDTIDAILSHETGLILIVLVLLKVIATSLTLGSGGSGGLFCSIALYRCCNRRFFSAGL